MLMMVVDVLNVMPLGNAFEIVRIVRNGVLEGVIHGNIFIATEVNAAGRTPREAVGASLMESVLSLSQEGTRHISSDFTAHRCYSIEARKERDSWPEVMNHDLARRMVDTH